MEILRMFAWLGYSLLMNHVEKRGIHERGSGRTASVTYINTCETSMRTQ